MPLAFIAMTVLTVCSEALVMVLGVMKTRKIQTFVIMTTTVVTRGRRWNYS